MLIDIKEVVQNSLSSRFRTSLEGKTKEKREENTLMFKKHTTLLSDFIQKEYLDKGFLSIDFFQGLHRLFYPSGYIIKATGNDNIEVENFPGEWRKQKLSPYITDFSKNENIPENLAHLISDFNSLQEKTRESVLEFYMKFGKIHPFGDSNGTVSAILADVQCTMNGFKPLNYLHIRFQDKNFLFHTIELYAQDSSKQGLRNILDEIDSFNASHNYPSITDIYTT